MKGDQIMAYPFKPNAAKKLKAGKKTTRIETEPFQLDESGSCETVRNNPTRKRSHLKTEKQIQIESCC